MDLERTRKFQIIDLMLLTASTALGLGLVRYFQGTRVSYVVAVNELKAHYFVPTHERLDKKFWATATSVFLAVWSPALLIARLRSPRPKFWSMFWRPGILVPLIATLMLGVYFTKPLANAARDGWPLITIPTGMNGPYSNVTFDFFPRFTLPGMRASLGPAIAIATAISILVRRIRQRPVLADFIDRLAIFLGFAWSAIYFVKP